VRPWVLPLAAGALITLGVSWFLTGFERVPGKERVGPSGEAARDPFLAAQRFAVRMGMRTRQLRALPDLDTLAHRGILLLPAGRQAIDRRRLRSILSWVEQGGILIVEAEMLSVRDPLLDELNVSRRRHARMPPLLNAKVFQAQVPGSDRTLGVSFPYDIKLDAPQRDPIIQISDNEATKLMSFEHGKGLVTVAASLHFARNRQIGLHDDAEFLWKLLELAPVAELQVFLVPERLSLWSFLRQQAAPVLISAAALLLAWLWRIGPRFGPVLPDAPPARRRLLDHLRASGRYYWAKGLRSRLVLAARDAALRHVARAQPDFAFASAEERATRLASLISISEDQATQFMRASGTASGAEFIQLMHTAHRIHSALEKGHQ
jgi:hypothetical protein